MRIRIATTSILIATSAVCVLTGCATLERMGFDEVVDERDWTWPEATGEPSIPEDVAVTDCIDAVVARFDVESADWYPEANAKARRLHDDWAIKTLPSREHSDEATYYCITDGTIVAAHTKDEYQAIIF